MPYACIAKMWGHVSQAVHLAIAVGACLAAIVLLAGVIFWCSGLAFGCDVEALTEWSAT